MPKSVTNYSFLKSIIFTLIFIHVAPKAIKAQSIGCLTHVDANDPSVVDATVDIDRKIFPFDHSQGYLHNFFLPDAPSEPCKKILSVEIDINIMNVDLSNMGTCIIGDYYFNMYQGCPVMMEGTCPGTNIVYEGFNSVLQSDVITLTCSPTLEFEFGEVLGVDIVPAMDTGSCPNWQNIIADGSFSAEYEICVTVTIGDDVIDTPVDLGADPTLCTPGSLILDAGSGYDTYLWSQAGEMTQDITVSTPNTYTVTVSDANGCTDTDEIVVQAGSTSVSIFSSEGLTVCSGETTNLTANTAPGSSFMWNPNGEITQTISVGMGTYTVTVTDSDNCTATDQIVITENNPTVTISPDPVADICAEDMVTITANYPNGTVMWSTSASSDAINVGPGTYTVTVTDADNCTATDQVTIGTLAAPTITISPTDLTACDNGDLTVTASGGVNYLWNDPANSTTSMVDLVPGSYEVTVTDANGCTNTSDVVVNGIAPPNAGTSNLAPELVCNNGDLYDIDFLLGPHDTGGSWIETVGSSGINLNANSTTVSFLNVPAGMYEFTYTVVGNPPCANDQAVIMIEVLQQSNAGISNTIPLCDNSIILNFFNEIANPDVGGTWQQIDGPFVDISNPSSVSFAGLSNDDFVFTYSFPDNGVCAYIESILTIQLGAPANAGDDSNIPISICEGADLDLNTALSSDANTNGVWIDTDGSFGLNGNIFTSTGLAGLSFNFTYQVGTLGDPCGQDEAVITVIVGTTVNAGDDLTLDLCMGDIVDLQVALQNEDLGGSFSDIDGIGGITGTVLNTSTSTAGVYEIDYVVGDGVSCPQETSTITVNLSATPTVTVTGPTSLCDDQCEDININLTGTGPYFYSLDSYSAVDGLIDLYGGFTLTDNQLITICNDNGTGTFINDTLHINNLSNWYLNVSALSDANCDVDLTGLSDTLFISTLGATVTEIDSTICVEDAIMINGTMYDINNTMGSDTLAGVACDSIINIVVDFYVSDTMRFEQTLCPEESIDIDGTIYDINNPSDNLIFNDENGCDSIIIIDLSFYPPAEQLLDQTLCTGDFIIVNGTTYDAANPTGTETLIDQSVNGCDSIVNIDLSFGGTATATIDDELCSDESITFNGTLYDINNQTGMELITGTGCDTLYTIALQFISDADSTIMGPFCTTFSTVVNGTTYDISNPTGSETFMNASSQGCDSIVTINLMFYPTSEFNINDVLCSDEEIMVNGTVYNELNPAGTEIIIGGSSTGCDSTINVNLQFNPTYNIPQSEMLCDGDSLYLENAWQFTAGVYNDTLLSTTNCDSVIVTTLSFIPCSDPVTVTTQDNICGLDSNGVITININMVSLPITVTWIGANTGISDVTGISDISMPFVIDNLPSDTYSLTLVDATGTPIYSQSVLIMDLNDPVLASYQVIEDINCSDDTAIVEVNVSGGQGTYSYNWNDPMIGDTPSATAINAGQYEVTVTDQNNCTDSLSFDIMGADIITFQLNVVNTGCNDSSDGSIEVVNINGGLSPYTIFVNGTALTGTIATGLTVEDYDIEVFDSNNCSTLLSTPIIALSDDNFLDYTMSYMIELGDSITLAGTSSDIMTQYVWTSNADLSCLDCANPVATPTDSQQYTLTGTNSTGCDQMIMIDVIVEKPVTKVYIPNTFSPNNDGVNDTFTVFTKDGLDSNTIINMSIYDRWGNMIYTGSNVDSDLQWDGTFKGDRIVNGVYAYVVQVTNLDGSTEVFKGSITVVE